MRKQGYGSPDETRLSGLDAYCLGIVVNANAAISPTEIVNALADRYVAAVRGKFPLASAGSGLPNPRVYPLDINSTAEFADWPNFVGLLEKEALLPLVAELQPVGDEGKRTAIIPRERQGVRLSSGTVPISIICHRRASNRPCCTGPGHHLQT